MSLNCYKENVTLRHVFLVFKLLAIIETVSSINITANRLICSFYVCMYIIIDHLSFTNDSIQMMTYILR